MPESAVTFTGIRNRGETNEKVLTLIAILLAITTSAGAQTFKETSIAFRKFEAKIRAGISLNRYSDAMADIEYAASEYAANANPANKVNAEAFKAALEKYKLAGAVWELYNAAARNEVLDVYGSKLSRDYCPKSILHKSFGVSDCLNENWTQAAAITKDLHEVTEPVKPEKTTKKAK